LEDKFEKARWLKQTLMRMHGINDHKDVVGFRCQHCSCVFDQPTALGGHMSKAHPQCKNGKRGNIEETVRSSSIERIKKYEFIHNEATGIHRENYFGDEECF